MSDIACSKGCFVCGGYQSGIHDGGCCASTRCNSRMWERQVKKWLAAEKKWKSNAGAMTTRWLIAEQLWKTQVEQWLTAEVQHRYNIEDWLEAELVHHTKVEEWLVAEQQYNEQYRVQQLQRPAKKVNRVNVPAKPRTPVTSAAKKAATVMHGVG